MSRVKEWGFQALGDEQDEGKMQRVKRVRWHLVFI